MWPLILLLPPVSHALDPNFRRTCAKGTAPLVSVAIVPPLDTAAKLFAAYPCAMFVTVAVETGAVIVADEAPPDLMLTLKLKAAIMYCVLSKVSPVP